MFQRFLQSIGCLKRTETEPKTQDRENVHEKIECSNFCPRFHFDDLSLRWRYSHTDGRCHWCHITFITLFDIRCVRRESLDMTFAKATSFLAFLPTTSEVWEQSEQAIVFD